MCDQYSLIWNHFDLFYIKGNNPKLLICNRFILGKFEEREIKIPKYAELNEYFSPPIDNKTYLSIELQLLSSFQ